MGSEGRLKVKNQHVPLKVQGSPPETPPFTDEELFAKFISKLGKDTFSYLPAAIIPAGLSLVSVMIFTHIFTPNAYGQYALVTTATGILTALLTEWIKQSVLRYSSRFRGEQRLARFSSTLAFVLLATALLFVLLSSLTYPFLRPFLGGYSRFYFPGVLFVVAGFLFYSLAAIFQANLQAKRYAKYQIASAVGRLFLALAFVLLVARDVLGLIIAAAVSYFILIGPMAKESGLLSYRKNLFRFFDPSLLRKIAAYGFPMIGWFMGVQILGFSDRFIIGAFKGPSQVGVYASNYSLISRGLGLVTGPILMAAHPLIVNAWEKGNKDQIQKIIATFSRYFLLATIPFMAYVSVFSHEIVGLLLGKAYREGYVIMPIILAGFLVWNFSMYGHKGLELMEKTRIMLLLVVICAVTNIILNLFFVPLYGYKGAAVTTLISYLLYPLLVYRATKPYVKWQIPWRSVGNIAISSLILAGLLVALRSTLIGRLNIVLSLVIAGGIALLIYFGSLYILREIKTYEIRYLKLKAGNLGFKFWKW